MQEPVNLSENTHKRPAQASGRDARAGRRPKAESRIKRVLPPLVYPEDLPVSARRADIAAAIQAHQVVIVCGETGSGKTTQLPKVCLELGRGQDRKSVVSGKSV